MRKLYFILLFTIAYSTVIHVPGDYTTIQAGIDASVDGDTVLVADGIYYETLVVSKSIVLASHAIYDDLTDWVVTSPDYEWVVHNPHIQNTQIIGSQPDNPDYASVILITPEEDTCISPEIMGFSIRNGNGTVVSRIDDEGEPYNVRLGGGILADVSDPLIHYNGFYDNGNSTLTSGGAIQLTSSTEDWSFNDRENRISRCDINQFRLSNNLYKDNDAQHGNSVANRFHEDEFDMSSSIFDVYNCGGGEGNQVSVVWVDVEEEASVDYSASEGNACAFTAPDVYVDSNIDEECLDEGCGFQNNPFKTITRALEIILPSESNPITIHLAVGIYSPETGESFPIDMISNVNIEGEDEFNTILDAMETGGVIAMDNCDNNNISFITITGGNSDNGGGMYLESSNSILINVTISNNTAGYYGGGMNLYSSNPTLNNVTISNNTAYEGGGMSIWLLSNPMLTNVTITNNTADKGGGILLDESNPMFTNVAIENNTALDEGGGMMLVYSHPTLTNVTITNNIAYEGGGIFLDYESNPILTNVIIANNIADDGGGMIIDHSNPTLTNVTITDNTAESYGGGVYIFYSNPTFINSIIWGNGSESIDGGGFTNVAIITYSDIEGNFEGEGNIDADPLFTDAENGDYTLQENSPCIDTGTADTDGDGVDDITDFIGLAPDMGAFEYGATEEVILGDTNSDGIVDILDILRVVNYILGNIYFNEAEYEASNYNGDDIIDILDVMLIVNHILSE